MRAAERKANQSVTLAYCTDGEFRQMVSHLRTVAPAPKGCSVEVHRIRAHELGEAAGECAKNGRRFHISLRQEMTLQETEETLIHEWAHMLAWKPYHPLTGDHGPEWGVCYAAAYSAYFGIR